MRFVRPYYADMWNCIWFVAFDWLIIIDFDRDKWRWFSKIKDKDYRIGILRVTYDPKQSP